jgi:hypothetical protein
MFRTAHAGDAAEVIGHSAVETVAVGAAAAAIALVASGSVWRTTPSSAQSTRGAVSVTATERSITPTVDPNYVELIPPLVEWGEPAP